MNIATSLNNMIPQYRRRSSYRLHNRDYSINGWYYITICTKNRINYFGNIVDDKIIISNIGRIAKQWWENIPKHFKNVMIDKYIVMPNHLHGIIIIDNDNDDDNIVGAIHELPLQIQSIQMQRHKMLLPKIIGYFKMNSAKYINRFMNKSDIPVWQRNYYDHIIRDKNSIFKIRDYIINNPIMHNRFNHYRRGFTLP